MKIAQGSLKELETLLLLSERVGITTRENVEPLLGAAEEVGRMIRALIGSLQRKVT